MRGRQTWLVDTHDTRAAMYGGLKRPVSVDVGNRVYRRVQDWDISPFDFDGLLPLGTN